MRKNRVVITKTMSIDKVLNLDENVAPILLGFGLHCLGCPMSRAESLEEACMVHGADADLLVEKLNEYFNGTQK
ncbi:MAG: DUF1858 domain-containing protein [Clostridia bacterium]|nr:DUF1858 domain-containing protein [Clostridia bacterium]